MISRSALAIAAVLALTAWLGAAYLLQRTAYGEGFTAGELAGKAQVFELEAQHALLIASKEKEARERIESLASRLLVDQHTLNDMAGELASQQRQYRETTDRLTGELARVTTQYRRSLDAAPEPLPACVFTRDFVRLYDDAIGAYPLLTTSDPARATAPTASSSAAWELDSGIGQREFLTHHIRYAEQCRASAAQLSKLIDTLEVTHATRN